MLPDDSLFVQMCFAVFSLVLIAVLWALFRIHGISAAGLHPVVFATHCVLPIGIVAGYCRWSDYRKLCEGFLLVGWAFFFENLLQWPQYVAARSGLPLRDVLLLRADHLLGIDVPSIVTWVRAHPAANHFWWKSYALMFPLVAFAMLVPPLAGHIERARIFLWASAIACVVGAFVLALIPAVGPWVSGSFQPYPNQQLYTTQFKALRGSQPFVADLAYSCGLITFPSFHAVMAALSCYALWPFRWLRIPAIIVGGLVVIATVATGWHYACDGLGGMLLALIAVFLARELSAGTERYRWGLSSRRSEAAALNES